MIFSPAPFSFIPTLATYYDVFFIYNKLPVPYSVSFSGLILCSTFSSRTLRWRTEKRRRRRKKIPVRRRRRGAMLL